MLIRMAAFVVFALFVGLLGRVTRRLRARRARRWRLTSSRHVQVMVGHCTTLPEVHETYGALDARCPFCTAVLRPAFRRTHVGPLVLDWYASPPATEALPDDDDDDQGTTRPILLPPS